MPKEITAKILLSPASLIPSVLLDLPLPWKQAISSNMINVPFTWAALDMSLCANGWPSPDMPEFYCSNVIFAIKTSWGHCLK